MFNVMRMEDLNKNLKNSSGGKIEKKIKIQHPDSNKSTQGRKVSLSKKITKTYKVTVTYIQLTDEEAKMKRAIIESIIKKGSYKNPG